MHIHLVTMLLIFIRCSPNHGDNSLCDYPRCSHKYWVFRYAFEREANLKPKTTMTKPSGKVTEISQTTAKYDDVARR